MPKDALTPDQVVAMLNEIADAVIAAEPELSEADRKLGDGDHGLGMKRGMTAAKEALAAGSFETVDKAFSAVGVAMMSSMGGASGALFGTLFRNGGKALSGRGPFNSDGLAEFLQAGLAGVMARGGAKPGDKTMIDALAPAAEEAKVIRGEPLPSAAAAVATAAAHGREASKALVATMGRAKTLGDRSVGHPDAGACSVAVILQALASYVAD
ncbi:dihydroxyacetone kinase subunit DhaL [soil metagenome]